MYFYDDRLKINVKQVNLFLHYIHFAIHTKFHDNETAHVAVIQLQPQPNTEHLQIN